ncbi:MAG: class I SAM-dependent methyltransferase [Devosia sp.]|nr:class I SAM-dependent methyltransferase [Devosia sp.]
MFYDFNSGGGINVFNLSEQLKQAEAAERMPGYDVEKDGVDVPARGQGKAAYGQIKTEKVHRSQLIREFMAARPELQAIDFSQYGSPLTTLLQAFPGAGVYNGMSQYKKTRVQSIRDFNDDAKPEANLLLVQKAANAGWSGHDTTGKHGRVRSTGLPVAPIEAIQEEGRIYRVGQKSDANFQYFNTGTNWERYAFGSKIARRAGTAENLAMGEQARGLREAFIQAFENSDPDYEPGETDGRGGKVGDRDLVSAITEWDRARSLYFAQQKKTARTKAAEGVDYYATPEPLGLKMVEWAGILPGERVLEPSAGHGAIARWFPEKNDRTVIEPSLELASRLTLATDAKLINERFEGHDTINKYDAIVMNPPFGVGGKTAIEHLDKALRHLADGGRLVALIPEGPTANKRFDDPAVRRQAGQGETRCERRGRIRRGVHGRHGHRRGERNGGHCRRRPGHRHGHREGDEFPRRQAVREARRRGLGDRLPCGSDQGRAADRGAHDHGQERPRMRTCGHPSDFPG